MPSRKSAGSGEGWCTCRRCMRAGRRRQRAGRSGGVRRSPADGSPPARRNGCPSIMDLQRTTGNAAVVAARVRGGAALPVQRAPHPHSDTSLKRIYDDMLGGPGRSRRSTATCAPAGPAASRTAPCRTGERTTTPPLSHDEQDAAIAAYLRWRTPAPNPRSTSQSVPDLHLDQLPGQGCVTSHSQSRCGLPPRQHMSRSSSTGFWVTQRSVSSLPRSPHRFRPCQSC